MSNSEYPLIHEVLSLIEMMEESCRELASILDTQENICFDDCQILFNDLAVATSSLISCAAPLKDQLHHAFFEEMTENIDTVLCDAVDQIKANPISETIKILNYQLLPFIKELWEEVYFWGTIYPDEKRMEHYYKEEFALHHSNLFIFPNGKPQDSPTYKYKVSIFIPVFNKLDYTKQCIKSIMKNTDFKKYSCEFILLNDGSTDGTQEYLETLDLGVEKKLIHLRKNVKALIFSLAYRASEGEYFLFVNNDTLVTKGWLDNLLLCMESDPLIVSATPCTPNTSNLQSDLEGRYSFSSVEDVLRHENHSIPALWEIRARIMPVIALYRSELVNRIGFADRLFYTMEFWDDDFSLRARRAGYQQILCRDTYCHHFGSVTGKSEQVKENTLEKGRSLFQLKNHVDAWGEDFCYDQQAVAFVKSLSMSDRVRSTDKIATILGIDCGFGDTLLQMKSHLRSKQSTAEICVITCEDTYKKDLESISDHFIHTNHFYDTLQGIKDESFNYIYLQKPLESYQDEQFFLRILYGKLKKDGIILFSASNIFYKPFLESLLKISFPTTLDSVRFLNLASFQNHLRSMFSQMECIALKETSESVKNFRNTHIDRNAAPTAIPLLSARILKFCCRK